MNNYIENAGVEVKSSIKANTGRPLDARILVDKVSDLYNIHTWAVGDHNHLNLCKYFLYDGMIVATSEMDESGRPQVYVLHGINDFINIDCTLKNVPDDPSNWLSNENWQRLGYVLDVAEQQFSFMMVKYGWTFDGVIYDGPKYTSDAVDVYTIDANNHEPGHPDYIQTPASAFRALKMQDSDSDYALYVDARTLSNHTRFYTDCKNIAVDLQTDENIIFGGKGAIESIAESFEYNGEVFRQPGVSYGLKMQPIGPKPSCITVIIDCDDKMYFDDPIKKQLAKDVFEYTSFDEVDSKEVVHLLKYTINHRMTYDTWTTNEYESVLIFPDSNLQILRILNSVSGVDSSWTLDSGGGRPLKISTLNDLANLQQKCYPGQNYTIVLKKT